MDTLKEATNHVNFWVERSQTDRKKLEAAQSFPEVLPADLEGIKKAMNTTARRLEKACEKLCVEMTKKTLGEIGKKSFEAIALINDSGISAETINQISAILHEIEFAAERKKEELEFYSFK